MAKLRTKKPPFVILKHNTSCIKKMHTNDWVSDNKLV